MENQITSTSVPAEQPQVLSPQPSMQQFVPLPNSVSPGPIAGAVIPQDGNSPMQFLMRMVDRLMPNQPPSMPSNPSQVTSASLTTPPQAIAQPEPLPQEQAYWAGTGELTQFLEENGVSNIQDLLQYTAGQEQSAEQMGEIFEYAMHPDPQIREQFWSHYQQALVEQGVIDQQQPQSPSLPGTPESYGYGNHQQGGFNSLDQFAQNFSLMSSGLPGVTPQSLADFDRAVLMTPGSFWAQHVFDLGEI